MIAYQRKPFIPQSLLPHHKELEIIRVLKPQDLFGLVP